MQELSHFIGDISCVGNILADNQRNIQPVRYFDHQHILCRSGLLPSSLFSFSTNLVECHDNEHGIVYFEQG